VPSNHQAWTIGRDSLCSAILPPILDHGFLTLTEISGDFAGILFF